MKWVVTLAKSKKLKDDASRLYESGLSIDAVAVELNVCYRTARKAIRSSGTVIRDPSSRLRGRTSRNKRKKVSGE